MRAISRKFSPRSRIARKAPPADTRALLRRCAACASTPFTRSVSHVSMASSRSRAEKNAAKSSTFARVRRSNSSWDAAAASRAARRASLVIALFAMHNTLKPVNPLRRNRTQQSCLPPTPRLCTRPLTNAPCLVQLKIATDAPRSHGFAI